MLKPEYDSEKFLYKIKKWGSLNADVNFLLYTDHTQENRPNLDFDFTFIVIVSDCLEFTHNLQWISYFGRVDKHTLSSEEESQNIIVKYIQGPKVKFTFFETKTDIKETTSPHSKIFVNKKL